MGRPKAVIFEKFHLYDKLHTKKIKMMSGTEITTLYPIKETDLFYRSIEVWASCSYHFKHKKKDFKLEVNIPVIEELKTQQFLNKKCWAGWVAKCLNDNDKRTSEMKESTELLSKLFPDKKLVYFYELNSIIHAYCSGTFISYDNNGNIEEPSEHNMKNRKYYTHKYEKFIPDASLIKLRDKWTSEKDEKKSEVYLTEYHTAEEEYAYKNHCLDNVFIEIGKNAVCYPVAFSKGTAEWSKEKDGKYIAYAFAGEIYFVVTKDAVYFETCRHF